MCGETFLIWIGEWRQCRTKKRYGQFSEEIVRWRHNSPNKRKSQKKAAIDRSLYTKYNVL